MDSETQTDDRRRRSAFTRPSHHRDYLVERPWKAGSAFQPNLAGEPDSLLGQSGLTIPETPISCQAKNRAKWPFDAIHNDYSFGHRQIPLQAMLQAPIYALQVTAGSRPAPRSPNSPRCALTHFGEKCSAERHLSLPVDSPSQVSRGVRVWELGYLSFPFVRTSIVLSLRPP